jgi:2-dehydropantoate 2-reductase
LCPALKRFGTVCGQFEGCTQHIRCLAAHQHPLQSNCCKIYVQKWFRIFISLPSESNSCYNRFGQIKEGEHNMKIQSVAILGAGAVGSYIIWGLSKKDNIRLGVIAEGDRARRLKESGCAINGAVYRPEVWTPQEAQGVDLLVVALKYGSLPGALESIKTAVGSNTVVMSLMNGVDSEELIAAQVGAEHLLYSFIKVTSHKEADGYHFDPDATLGVIYGERFAPFESERVQAVRELFTDSGVNFRVTEHIQEEMWSKFRLNVCNNLPQAILGAGVGCYRDSVHMKAISDGLRRELEAIATARGIDLRIADAVSHGCAVPATARYSTLQDLDAGRHTEIDMFSGALMRMGKELGIPTPYNEYTYHMIKAMEEKNDGLFDYDGTEEPTWAK